MDDLQGNQPPRWRELLDHRGAVIVLACGVLVGAVNIYLASSLLRPPWPNSAAPVFTRGT
jgi:hypothetical protein